MKESRLCLSRRTVLKEGVAMFGLFISWHLLPRIKVARVQAAVAARGYGTGSYGASAYGSSLNVYLPIITK
jgi:hypothetical protein